MSDTATETAQRVTVTLTGGVADVRLNRPEKRNALDPAMFAGLVAAGERLMTQPGLRAVVLSGEGPDFCAGLDFSSFQEMRDGSRFPPVALPPSGGPTRVAGQQAAYVWAELPVPVIAAVRGNALGGGLQVALGADIRIVAPDARLSVFEAEWGLIPDMTGTQLLPELVGRDVAKELTYTARIVSGEEAVRIGLATRTDPDPLAAALAMATEIARRNPHAIRAAKRLLDLAGRTDLASGFAAEQEESRALIGSPNQVEAVTARFENRDPSFAEVLALSTRARRLLSLPLRLGRGSQIVTALAAIPQGGVEPSRSHYDPSENVDPQQHGDRDAHSSVGVGLPRH
jgi:enoyl-CoA hydratase/carnithine racemase